MLFDSAAAARSLYVFVTFTQARVPVAVPALIAVQPVPPSSFTYSVSSALFQTTAPSAALYAGAPLSVIVGSTKSAPGSVAPLGNVMPPVLPTAIVVSRLTVEPLLSTSVEPVANVTLPPEP